MNFTQRVQAIEYFTSLPGALRQAPPEVNSQVKRVVLILIPSSVAIRRTRRDDFSASNERA